MCLPIAAAAGLSHGALSTLSILNTVASVGSTVLGFAAQQQQAAAQDAMYEANKQNAANAEAQQYAAALEQHRLDEANDVRRQNENNLAAYRAAGTARASSMNEGNSYNATLRDLMNQSARNNALIESDAQIRDQNLQNQLAGIGAQYANRVSSVQKGTSPSYLQLAVSGLGSYMNSQLGLKQFQYSNPMQQYRKPKIDTSLWANEVTDARINGR